jgi:hypothetical protein
MLRAASPPFLDILVGTLRLVPRSPRHVVGSFLSNWGSRSHQACRTWCTARGPNEGTGTASGQRSTLTRSMMAAVPAGDIKDAHAVATHANVMGRIGSSRRGMSALYPRRRRAGTGFGRRRGPTSVRWGVRPGEALTDGACGFLVRSSRSLRRSAWSSHRPIILSGICCALASSISWPPAKSTPKSNPNTAACIRAMIRAVASITTGRLDNDSSTRRTTPLNLALNVA